MKLGDDLLGTFKTRAVVLKTQEFKENDKLVWLYTEKLGKVSTIAKGAQKTSNKLLVPSLPFCFGEFILYKGKSLYIINECEIIDSFQEFLGDLDTLTYASYLSELIDISTITEESNGELFKLLVSTYYLLKHKGINTEILIRAFEIELLKSTGYGLILDRCTMCNKPIDKSNYIDLSAYGFCCSDCKSNGNANISYSTYNILKYISKLPFEKLNILSLTKNNKEEIYDILSKLIGQSYSRRPKSLDIFNYFIDKE
ncbi:MAG: DNA repair protein RecO [Clostridium sp.]